MQFNSNGHLTLGVEIELQLIDPETWNLSPVAPQLLAHTAHNDKIKPEIFQSMVEINTGICQNVQEVERDLRATLRDLQVAAKHTGVHIATTGTHPFARYSERIPYPSPRYHMLIERNQWIARRLMIFGMHVHLGMKDGDTCVRFNNFFLHLLPHLLALSASSPFWQGEDTGLASCRSTIFESCPTAGHPCRMKNWDEFSELCNRLERSKAITSFKDLWWDVRPSPDFGTLEIRTCDGLATLSETLSLVAFIHALAHWYEAHNEYNAELHAPFMWMMRENKWRAARHGLEADIIDDTDETLRPVKADIAAWLQFLEEPTQALGYETYMQGISHILEKGNSAMRQRRVFEHTQSMEAIVRHNVEEFTSGVPIYAA